MYIELYNGDCIDVMKKLPDACIDIGIFDLPYGILQNKWDKKINLYEMWNELKRLRKNKNTPFFFFCNARLGSDLICSNSNWFKYEMVWYKSDKNEPLNPYCGNFLNSKKCPKTSHELIYVFYEKQPCYNYLKYHKITKEIKNYGKHKTDYAHHINRGYVKWYEPKLPNDVLFFKKEYDKSEKKHCCNKPTDLIEWILKYYSNEGDTCIDITMGGCSTGIACKNLNRNFIGIELLEKWYSYSKNRLDMNDAIEEEL